LSGAAATASTTALMASGCVEVFCFGFQRGMEKKEVDASSERAKKKNACKEETQKTATQR